VSNDIHRMIHLKGFGTERLWPNRGTFWCLPRGTDGNHEDPEDSRSRFRVGTDHCNTNKSRYSSSITSCVVRCYWQYRDRSGKYEG
jgi:hypothetical protein